MVIACLRCSRLSKLSLLVSRFGKLDLYIAGAGIKPSSTVPICLDLGTNTQHYLDDPLYIGVRRPRPLGPEMDEFMDEFMTAMIAPSEYDAFIEQVVKMMSALNVRPIIFPLSNPVALCELDYQDAVFSHRGPRIVDLPTVQDRKPLVVAPQPRPQQQSQLHGQTQASSSQTQHTTTSTSTTPPAPGTGTTTAGEATAPSPHIPWWARLVLFLNLQIYGEHSVLAH
ncbi:hypothetical protein DEU56DRAFT_948782 [Suillus clintonianus]|uniref:uncharacterized protein n=1 Tax=Suillus clintonianus TaxID=1904413 RepID=UPI001B8604A1|nr:uncharacterized protein DEU56DRAFT_948782 [Suillus clintonianus]KAG2135844.1 hypothetical protein DEU56DRAFT_948782 [Suillus clintonianus]